MELTEANHWTQTGQKENQPVCATGRVDEEYSKAKPDECRRNRLRGLVQRHVSGAQTRIAYLCPGGNECEDYFFSACLDKKPLVSEVLSFSIDNGYVAPVVGVPFGLHKPWGEIPAKGHGRAYNEIKEKCEDVELLESLHNV